MAKLSNGTISALQPIVEAIDRELAKEQDAREEIHIETNNPKTLKNNLSTYKSLFRRDWNSRFWMSKRDDRIVVSFSPSEKLNFTLHVGVKPPVEEVQFNIVQSDGVRPGDGPALEMNDMQITQHLLMENPSDVQFSLLHISTETLNFLRNPVTAEPTALINFLQRRGYKYAVIMNTRLRIFT